MSDNPVSLLLIIVSDIKIKIVVIPVFAAILVSFCLERDVTVPNTLTSHETTQRYRAQVTILAPDVGKINRPSICDEIGPRCGKWPSIRDWPSI